ncbi:hypothetical protein [Pseudomonas fluorescens]|uniref:hypothetical protein n=1 Tax=Pseudomonas fluorescens TaxID=294 RepID=UPI001242F74B|nr:hypothetical protein [Pseudomonas fluorescens]VVN47583.1 hypothetical protein PS676_05900 [Pseudomonas fluorescens]
MKHILLASAALLAMPITGFADSLYLNCKQLSAPMFNFDKAYSKAPKNAREQFLMDAMEQGIIGNFMIPPTTWEINLSDKTIVSPEESHNVLAFTAASNNMIEGASEFDTTFKLNRINAKLEYSRRINEESVATWKKAHGGTIPSTITYEYICQSSSRPAI